MAALPTLTTAQTNELDGVAQPSPFGVHASRMLIGTKFAAVIARLNALVTDVGTLIADTISEYTAGTGVTVDGVLLKDSQVSTDQINEKTATAGVTIDGCLIKDGRAAALATAGMFASGELTGTGSEQDTAHGFAAAPSLAWAVLTELPAALAAGADVAYGTHDATNLKFTVTSGLKYRVYALK